MASAAEFSSFRAKTVLLVGSGSVAAALMRRLIEVGARVRWFPRDADVAEEIWLSRRPDRIEIALREPRVRDFEDAAAVIVAAGEPLASAVAAQARALGRPVVVLGRPELSTFEIDDSDDSGSGDAQPSRPWLGAPQRRASARLSDRLLRALVPGTCSGESLPPT